MSSKQVGYDFWNHVLGRPKFVAAPMVDMSELAYRMLCRNYGAQLCYSPMFHSLQFSQDFLYRQDNFSTCSEDRPLIVQFCANDPKHFVNAASIVSSSCDAVDLNLGCPQAIAKKGYYGSFLQDDWDVIRSIVQTAAYDLPIPVTCKMRILPGHFKKSIEYAKMLEHSGCSVLTVHGRTREQKGHATGLASWEVIKEIKANVNIPVIANGNILSFEDVEDCLEFTGADAVMSAESLLHNPALFSGKNPPVWKIVEEYLQIAEKLNTSIRCVRCHLFKILYLCIYQDEEVKRILTEGSSFSEFYSIIDILKMLPQKQSTLAENLQSDEKDSESILGFLNFNSQILEPFNNTSLPNKCTKELLPNIKVKMEITDPDPEPENDNSDYQEMTFEKHDYETLPVWICHSRPRITDNEKNRGCFSKYFVSVSGTQSDQPFMSKKKLRKARHHERVLASLKDKRKMKKMRRKQKIAETKRLEEPLVIDQIKDKPKSLTKKEQKTLIRERLLNAQGTSPKICINLGFSSSMETKELNRLSCQLRRLYGSNRNSSSPFHLFFCNFSPSDELYQICLSKNDGFSSYVVEMTSDAPEDMFMADNIVYLSPDAETVLHTIDESKVYVIGGIVDGTVKKDLSLNHAKDLNIRTAKLPIAEYLVPFSTNPGTTILTVNQVFDILLKYYETKDWTEALSINVPQRKGYCAPSKKNELINAEKQTLNSSVEVSTDQVNSCS